MLKTKSKQFTRPIVMILTVGGFAVLGLLTLLLTHADTTTSYGSAEAESGIVASGASKQSSSDASDESYVQFGSSTPALSPMLGALAPSASNSTLSSAGFQEVVISVDWSAIEPSEGSFSSSATTDIQNEINAAITAGLSPSLDIGVQYAPSWIFTVGGGTQFVDQYGTAFTGSTGSGNYVPNAVTDMNVRMQLGDYLAYLGAHLTGLASVRLGGAAYNEMRYPTESADSQGNDWWFYDSSSQALLPASAQGWTPGTGTVAQATTFLNAYNAAMVGYGVWLQQTAATAFPSATKLEMLLPGWGERPGQLSAAEANLLTSAQDEVHQGLDWADLLPELSSDGRVVAYSTYADATQGGGSNPDPAAYIHSILPTGMLQGGESTGNGETTTAGMNLMFQDAQMWHWYVANWFFGGQSQTLQQVDAAFDAAE